MDAAERKQILSRYLDHARRFDEAAARRGRSVPETGNGEVVPFRQPVRRFEQEPTARETQVLQLISEGLVNREIGRDALPLRGDGEVARAPHPREVAGPQPRPCSGDRLPPRPDPVRPGASPFEAERGGGHRPVRQPARVPLPGEYYLPPQRDAANSRVTTSFGLAYQALGPFLMRDSSPREMTARRVYHPNE